MTSKENKTFPRGVCVKATSLRPQYSDLEHFLSNKKNVLVCRRGRVWITNRETGEKHIFSWPDSPWANPYKVGDEYTLEEALVLYETRLNALLSDAQKRNEFMRLLQAENIGCFCAEEARCHRDVIVAKLRELSQ